MAYFTTESTTGTVRFEELPWSIIVVDSLDTRLPIGLATEEGLTPTGIALWSLEVNGAEVTGRYVIIDGRFVEIEAVPD
jgi:hypothetical protein